MCRTATAIVASALLVIAARNLHAQTDWRRIGTTTLSLGLASPAGGAVQRVWYSSDGLTLFVRTALGQVWRTADGDKWARADAEPPAQPAATGASPEPNARSLRHPLQSARFYAVGAFAWRSDDGGAHWTNTSGFQGRSILGGPLTDLAVSPTNPDEIVAAGASGVWRSVDGGASWAGLNDNLPNFPAQRLLAVPDANPSTRILTADGSEVTWYPGEHGGWRQAADSLLARETSSIASASAALAGAPVSAAVRTGDMAYAGTADGRLFVSADRGRTWRESPAAAGAGSVRRIYVDSRDGRFAVAITSAENTARVLRTVNAGVFWDDITADLPAGSVYGITADRLTGAVYIASSAGVFVTYTDVLAAAPATPWTRLREDSARDVMLDSGGNQLYVAFEGLGVYATMAPHRRRDPRVVNAGDRVLRAAAPGSLLSVLGARVEAARADEKSAPVLAASDTESQVQLPYDLTGNSVLVSFTSAQGRIQVGLPVTAASPAIFIDADGNPLITNADTGLVLDAADPARSNSRIQILATGLGRVTPNWPAGLPAPLQDPPRVAAPVRAWLDRAPVEVVRATLAPGYTGLYLVELLIPAIVNRGPAELYIQTGEAASNKVQIWLEP